MNVKKLKKKVSTFVIYVLAIFVALVFAFPILYMISISFKRSLDIVTWPPKIIFFEPTLDNWLWFLFSADVTAMAPQEGRRIIEIYLPNSIIVATVTTLLSVSTIILIAYSLARFNYWGRKPIAFSLIVIRMIPPVAAAVPIYIFVNSIGLRDTLPGLIGPYSAFNIAFGTWILYGFFKELPVEVEESALVDGCTRMQALFRIILPLLAPGLAVVAVFSFIFAWNDFIIALFLTAVNSKTMPIAALGFYAEEGVFWGPMCAYGTVYIIPTIIFVALVQKYIIKGLTFGAVKG